MVSWWRETDRKEKHPTSLLHPSHISNWSKQSHRREMQTCWLCGFHASFTFLWSFYCSVGCGKGSRDMQVNCCLQSIKFMFEVVKSVTLSAEKLLQASCAHRHRFSLFWAALQEGWVKGSPSLESHTFLRNTYIKHQAERSLSFCILLDKKVFVKTDNPNHRSCRTESKMEPGGQWKVFMDMYMETCEQSQCTGLHSVSKW